MLEENINITNKKLKTLKEGKIAKDFKIGNTRIKIATDFCEDKTPEKVQKILERISIAAKQSLVAKKLAEAE